MMPAISPTAQTFEIAFKKTSRKSNPRNPAEFAQMHEIGQCHLLAQQQQTSAEAKFQRLLAGKCARRVVRRTRRAPVELSKKAGRC
jgi:hypothetical protein